MHSLHFVLFLAFGSVRLIQGHPMASMNCGMMGGMNGGCEEECYLNEGQSYVDESDAYCAGSEGVYEGEFYDCYNAAEDYCESDSFSEKSKDSTTTSRSISSNSLVADDVYGYDSYGDTSCYGQSAMGDSQYMMEDCCNEGNMGYGSMGCGGMGCGGMGYGNMGYGGMGGYGGQCCGGTGESQMYEEGAYGSGNMYGNNEWGQSMLNSQNYEECEETTTCCEYETCSDSFSSGNSCVDSETYGMEYGADMEYIDENSCAMMSDEYIDSFSSEFENGGNNCNNCNNFNNCC